MKFSIRQMLIAMIGFAFYAAVVGAGANGSPIGYSLAVASALPLIILPIFGVLYWLAFAVVARSQRRLNKRELRFPAAEVKPAEELT